MIKKMVICVLLLIATLIPIGCGNDPFVNDNVTIRAYEYTVASGDCMDDILGYFYTRNTVFVDWATYRQKHFDINAHLTKNGRFLQPGDKVIVYTAHKKGK